MKRYLIIFLAILALGACKPAVGPGTTGAKGKPTHASVAGAKGLYLASAGASKGLAPRAVARSVAGRDIVTATGATLGAITASGVPATAEFTDANGDTVTVTVDQALQLTPNYLLFSYSGDYSGLAALNITSGAVAQVQAVPDNWALIYALGGTAWYISGSALVKTDLTSGASTVLSTGSEVYDALSGSPVTPCTDMGRSESWQPDTWIYADAAGNVYALEAQNTQDYKAKCITASGNAIDFGTNVWGFSVLSYFQNGKALIDQSTEYCYFETGGPEWSGSTQVGYNQNLYLVTFDPASPGVISWANTPAVASIVVPVSNIGTGAGQVVTPIGFGHVMQQTILTDGANTYTLTPSGFVAYDTSNIPVSYDKPGYGNVWPFVQNWSWSGGSVFAGTQTQVSMVKLSTPAVNQVLVNDPGLISWSVVGGQLFWTNASGTQTAAINASAGTLGAASAYSGGAVVAVTQ